MPLTFPSHQTVVLPLKLWRPRWFDGVAMCAGSAAPDVAYAFNGFKPTIQGHTVLALLWWNLPVALLGTWLIRWGAPVVAAHLPRGGSLRLRDYAILGEVRHRWFVTVPSALLGAVSHLCADLFTHGAAIGWTQAHGIEGWEYAQLWTSVLLAFGTVAIMAHIGRRRLLRVWHGRMDAEPSERRPGLFWTVFGLVAGVLTALIPVLPGDSGLAVPGVRVLCAVAVGLLAAAAAIRVARTARSRARSRVR